MIASKLNLKAGMTCAVLNMPSDIALDFGSDIGNAQPKKADAVIGFARVHADIARFLQAVVEAARQDRIAWIAYPKGGKLGTDLNRDILGGSLTAESLRPVRQISIDDTWSALRFRPA